MTGNVRKALAGVRPGTVLDAYVTTYGLTKGAYRAGTFVQIALVVKEHGRNHSARQYAAFWGVDQRTAMLHRRYAREVYGDRWRDVAVALLAAMESAGVDAPGPAAQLAPV